MVNLSIFAKLRIFLKNKASFTKKSWLITGVLILTYVLYFSFGFYHISQFITADEHFWVNQRIYTYWHSLKNPDNWGRTKLSDKPGVTVALVSGVGLLWESDPLTHMRSAASDPENGVKVAQAVYTVFRIPILIFSALFSLYLFWIVKKLTGNFWIGLWSFILILLSPILLGISQITNADAVMWSFSSATLLSFLAYLQTEEKKFLVLCPLFLGMSLLTKLVAVIFFPFLFLIALAFIIYKFSDWEKERIEIHKKIIKIFFAYLITFAGSLAVFSIFMPAVFKDFQVLLDYTIGYSSMRKVVPALMLGVLLILSDAWALKSAISKKILSWISPYFPVLQKIVPVALIIIFSAVLVNWSANQFILNPDSIINYKTDELEFLKTSSLLEQIMYQFYFLAYSLVPLVLFSLLFLWAKFVLKKISRSFLIFILSSFILAYYLALIALNLPSTIRYSIALYPLASILAAIGIYEFFKLKKLEKISKIWITIGIIFISFISLWQIKPFYLNYTSDLLPKKYSIAMAWGYGGYEAAQFLNSLPDARDLFIWSDYYGVRNFFVGESKTDYIHKASSRHIDYYVLTKQGQIMFNYWCAKSQNICRKAYVPAGKYYEATNPVWEMDIDGRPNNFIKIFKAEE
ncbi:MAG: phospholipid carrier-dependent glycosyltransferase [Parcubacteria group bacterium]